MPCRRIWIRARSGARLHLVAYAGPIFRQKIPVESGEESWSGTGLCSRDLNYRDQASKMQMR